MLDLLYAFSEVLLPVAVIVTLGYLLRRTFPLDVRTLNRVSLYVLTPSLVFVTLLRTDIAAAEADAKAARRGLRGPPCNGETASVPT